MSPRGQLRLLQTSCLFFVLNLCWVLSYDAVCVSDD
jgi:hypothetical protein